MDVRNNWTKGTAFRCFKAILGELTEGEDYCYLEATTKSSKIEALRKEGRIYATTVNAILLSPRTCAHIEASK